MLPVYYHWKIDAGIEQTRFDLMQSSARHGTSLIVPHKLRKQKVTPIGVQSH